MTKNVCEIFQNVFRQFLGDEAREGEDIFCGNIQSFVSTLKRQQRKNTVGNDKPDIHGILNLDQSFFKLWICERLRLLNAHIFCEVHCPSLGKIDNIK